MGMFVCAHARVYLFFCWSFAMVIGIVEHIEIVSWRIIEILLAEKRVHIVQINGRQSVIMCSLRELLIL